MPLSASLDHVGPLTRSVADAALLWAVLTGRAPATPVPAPLSGLRLTRSDGLLDSPIAPDVRTAFERALALAADGRGHARRTSS